MDIIFSSFDEDLSGLQFNTFGLVACTRVCKKYALIVGFEL
jgi:hypothetical protein